MSTQDDFPPADVRRQGAQGEYVVPSPSKAGRFPATRVPFLKPKALKDRALGERASRNRALESEAGVNGRVRDSFRELQVLIPSGAQAGALARALEASRPLAERGAEICVVHGADAHGVDPAVHAVVGRFPFTRLVKSEPSGLRGALTVGLGQVPDRTVTLFASPHASLDVASTLTMMREIAGGGARAAIAPRFVAPDGAELPASPARELPLVWMAHSASLGYPGACSNGHEHPSNTDAALRLQLSAAAEVLVPCPSEVPRAHAGREERQPLAT